MANRTAVIWGAAGGMGRSIVSILSGEGWDVHGVARDAARLRDEIANPTRAHAADVGDPSAVRAAADDIGRLSPGAALWVYAVGDILTAKAEALEPEAWQRIIAADLSGAFYAARFSLPHLAPDAHLFFIGAKTDRLILPGLSAYASAKAGLETFVTVLAKEQRGRRVTLVRPGSVDTPLWRKVPFKPPAGALTPADVARAIVQAYDVGTTGVFDL